MGNELPSLRKLQLFRKAGASSSSASIADVPSSCREHKAGSGSYSLGLKKDFNNKKGSVGFGAENFFTPEFKIRGESNSPTYSQKNLNVLRNMGFRANYQLPHR